MSDDQNKVSCTSTTSTITELRDEINATKFKPKRLSKMNKTHPLTVFSKNTCDIVAQTSICYQVHFL